MILPYIKSYGSAQLLLGMTFGKYIIATKTGGMGEYLDGYSPCQVLPAADDESVATAIARACRYCAANPQWPTPPMAHLQWCNIAEELMRALEDRLASRAGRISGATVGQREEG
jgi:glycosyltransferase involved in cell wall biosynthesis